MEPGQKTHQVIRSIEKFIRDHRARAITLHGLRHVYAREEFEQKAGDSTNKREIRAAKERVAKELGHGRPEVTNIYLHSGKK